MSFKRILLGLLAIVLIGIAYFYFAFLRPIAPHQPTGAYNIGTTSFDFEYTAGEQRKIAVRAWYPSNADTGEIALISSQRMVSKTVEYFQMPEFMAVTEPSLSFLDAPFAEGKFPVIVFNHGFGSFAEQNTNNMQELASNGYIVLSISHPGISLLTEYSDGTYVYNNPDLPGFVEQVDLEAAADNSFASISTAMAAATKASNFDQYWQAMQTLGQSPPFANMQPFMREWIADSNALIDAIANAQTAQFPADIAAAMDGENIGIFGHSLGGMTALAVGLVNPKVKAVLNLDGPFAYDVPAPNLDMLPPTCMAMAENISLNGKIGKIGEINTPLLENAPNGGCVAIFKGAWHMNFTDINYAFGLLRLLGVIGPVNQANMGAELNNLLVNFFDRHLKGANAEYTPIFETIVEYRAY